MKLTRYSTRFGIHPFHKAPLFASTRFLLKPLNLTQLYFDTLFALMSNLLRRRQKNWISETFIREIYHYYFPQ